MCTSNGNWVCAWRMKEKHVPGQPKKEYVGTTFFPKKNGSFARFQSGERWCFSGPAFITCDFWQILNSTFSFSNAMTTMQANDGPANNSIVLPRPCLCQENTRGSMSARQACLGFKPQAAWNMRKLCYRTRHYPSPTSNWWEVPCSDSSDSWTQSHQWFRDMLFS